MWVRGALRGGVEGENKCEESLMVSGNSWASRLVTLMSDNLTVARLRLALMLRPKDELLRGSNA